MNKALHLSSAFIYRNTVTQAVKYPGSIRSCRMNGTVSCIVI